ncbi:antibiotic biosynthesis monooxygenase [Rickettsiales bacterium]|nr:antibiotic biosynthesis monooxygenase [Rickettsiales bacterium]
MKFALKVAKLNIIAGKEIEFEKNFNKAQKIISTMKGYISHELHKSMDQENIYLLLVKWQNLKDHQEGFRKSPQYQEFRKLLHHFYDPFPKVDYFSKVNLEIFDD